MNIELRHITRRFGPVVANHDISAAFGAGRVVGVLGENGAGKSTLMKILAGYQPPDAGEVLLDGTPVALGSPQQALAHGIGMLMQDPLDVPAFTVLENFLYGLGRGLWPNRARARRLLADGCQRLGFTLDADAPVSALTVAGRQQLEIVRLLALGARALILDEPTTGISAEQKATLFGALGRMAHSDGMTVLLVSHKLEDVVALCDEVLVLRGGRVVGTRQAPLTPATLVTMMFPQALPAASRPARTPGAPVLALHHVTLRGPRVTVADLSLEVRTGEVIGLAGLDGSGQTLVLEALAGLRRPHAGRVSVNQHDMTRQPYRAFARAGVAYAGAGRVEEGLVADLTIAEHIALVTPGGLTWNPARARTNATRQIARYDVRGRPDDPVQTLSGGNQQRVQLALLPHKPLALVLDQPTRGLDVDSARWVWEQLLARDCAIVFSAPDLDEMVIYSDRILVFYAGRTVLVDDARAATARTLGRLIGGDVAPHSQPAAITLPEAP